MSDKEHKFEVIDGGSQPRRKKFADYDNDKWKVFDCPVCKREDGVEWSQTAVIVRGALTDGRKVSLDMSTEKELVCTRCLKLERGGLQYKPGLIAVWDEDEGWVRLDKV